MDKKYLLLMLLLAILAGFVGGAVANRFFTTQPVFAQKKSKPAKVIEAEEFRLVDKSGNIHIEIKLKEFTVSPKKPPVKHPVISIKQHGRDRLTLGLSRTESPVLRFSDPNGKTRLSLGVAEVGGEAFPSLDLYSKNGMITLSVAPTLGGYLELFGKDMECKAFLGLYPTGEPYLEMRDKDGKLRAIFGLKVGGFPHFTLYDETGRSRAILGCTELEAVRTGTVEKRPASSLVLFDKEGKVIWKVP
ncbi:MAG: hypothetical protein ACFFCW_21165 [Candidatus Hodarchaeota archaeon]